MLTEDVNEEEEIPVKKRRKCQLNKRSPVNDSRGKHTISVFKYISFTTKQFMGVFYVTDKVNSIF